MFVNAVETLGLVALALLVTRLIVGVVDHFDKYTADPVVQKPSLYDWEDDEYWRS